MSDDSATKNNEADLLAEGGDGVVPIAGLPTGLGAQPPGSDKWRLFEVFVRSRRGLSHNHVGSLHAADAEMALHNARDVYTRRQEGVSIWVIPSTAVTASSPDEKDQFFEPAADKIYRHPTFYDVPSGVQM